MTRIAAAILAGGRGERLGGVNKALLQFCGRTLLARALEAIEGADPVLLCGGANIFPAETGIAPQRILPDLVGEYGGPLAGVAAAVDYLAGGRADLLLTLAVDTPFFPADFVSRALDALAEHDGVIAAYGGQSYPTNAIWRLPSIAVLPDGVRSGTAFHSLKRLAGSISTVQLDYAGIAAEDPFANINTAADLKGLRARFVRAAT
ncbi:MAG: molybdenum cofactor guanylyltransferase [Devosia sp.]